MNLEKINQDSLYRQIIKKLESNFGELPTHGVIAGQAVASAIFELTGLMKSGVYNDLDVFCNKEEYPSFEQEYLGYDVDSKSEGYLPSPYRRSNKVEKVINSYHTQGYNSMIVHGTDFIGQLGYSIHKSTICPYNIRHNYILVDYYDSKETDRGLAIISSFDINCCQVSLDLKNKKISYSREFQDFLFSKELDISYFGTPMHSSVRLLRKQKDLGFTKLDQKKQLYRLQTVRKFFEYLEEEKRKKSEPDYFPANLFSGIYLKRFIEESDVLNDYYNIEQRNIHFEDTNKTKKFHVLCSKNYCEKTLKMLVNTYEMSNNDKKVRVEDFVPYFDSFFKLNNEKGKKKKNIVDFINRVIKLNSNFGSSMHLITDVINNNGGKTLGYKDLEIERYFLMNKKHNHLGAILKINLTIEEQMKAMKAAKWLENNKMGYMIGFIENGNGVAASDLLLDNYKGYFKEKNKIYLENLEKNNKDDFFKKEVLLASNDEIKIKEMSNEKDIFLEGESLGHCVGGYWKNIENLKSFIFSLEGGKKVNGVIPRSTLELQMAYVPSGELALITSQHKSYGNKNPNTNHIIVAKKLIDLINKKIQIILKEKNNVDDFSNLVISIDNNLPKNKIMSR